MFNTITINGHWAPGCVVLYFYKALCVTLFSLLLFRFGLQCLFYYYHYYCTLFTHGCFCVNSIRKLSVNRARSRNRHGDCTKQDLVTDQEQRLWSETEPLAEYNESYATSSFWGRWHQEDDLKWVKKKKRVENVSDSGITEPLAICGFVKKEWINSENAA